MTDATSRGRGATSALLTVVTVAVTVLAAGLQPGLARTRISRNLYVNAAHGSDSASGSVTAPFRTLQAALNRVTPGTVVHLAAGTYHENVATKVDGLRSARIVIEGPTRGTATLFGTRHVMAIRNSYYTLENFSIDGQEAVEQRRRVPTWPKSISAMAAFKKSIASLVNNDRLIYIDSGSRERGVTGTIVNHMILTGAGGECVRIRNNATNNLIKNTTIRYCGMYPVPHSGLFAYHNGEGVYIGTSPKSTDLIGWKDDRSSRNIVANDTIFTYGSECFDVKENAHDNTLRHTQCADNTEPAELQGSNVELRGFANIIDNNIIGVSAGYGVKIASDTLLQDLGRNSIKDNKFSGQPGGALVDRSIAPAGQTCGNTISVGTSPGAFKRLRGWSSPCQAAAHNVDQLIENLLLVALIIVFSASWPYLSVTDESRARELPPRPAGPGCC